MRPETERYWNLDASSVWHPYTKHSAQNAGPFPMIERGEGIYIYDTEGRRYLDAISSWWACNLGHGNPRLVDALTRQAAKLQHSILGNLSHPGAAELASKLCAFFPDGGRRVLFAGDGACAVEASLRVAVQYRHNIGETDRFRFASFQESYHGDTMGTMAVGFQALFHEPYRPLLFPVHQAETPVCVACPENGAESCDLRCFDSMERIFQKHSRKLTAVVVEPLCQGAAGMRMYRPAYLRCLSDLCRETGVLLIVDEIAMGFGRTGQMFAFEHAGIDPDIVTIGKSLTGGYLPMSAAIVKEHIFETFADTPRDNTFYHGHTFAGNPLASAVALECLKIYEEDRIVERSQSLGRRLAGEFEAFKTVPCVTNVRSLGMIGAFDLADTHESGSDRAQKLRLKLMAQGVIVRPLGTTVYLMLPLVTPEAVLAETTAMLLRAASEV